MHVYLLGYPGDIGGANTEIWHTVRLWRRYGVAVTAVPMWLDDLAWRARLESIGCKILTSKPGALTIPPGSVCVGFCNTQICHSMNRLRECKIVWVPCMNYLTDQEAEIPPFARYVFQSRYQQGLLQPQLAARGVPPYHCRLIRGAFQINDFPYCERLHRPGEPFVVGRLSRGDPKKWPANLWNTYGQIPNVRARVMGWTDRIARKCGPAPGWAETLPPCAQTARDFLTSIHCLVTTSDGRDHPAAIENWPRVGLEAMASGVPIVTENRGGWQEMLDHGRTGFFCDTPDQVVAHATRLAGNEALRQNVARAAREAVRRLTAPEPIWRRWERLFKELGA